MTLARLQGLLDECCSPGPLVAPHFDEAAARRLDRFAAGFRAVYDEAPMLDPAGHLDAWDRLREHAYAVYEVLGRHLDLRFEPACPYTTPAEIRADILEHGRLVVTTEHSEHPYWSVEDNCVFRVVHDVIPHVLYDREFTLVGEVLSYHDHLRFAPAGCEPALFTELFVYAAIRYTWGRYPERQKACAFPELSRRYAAEFPSLQVPSPLPEALATAPGSFAAVRAC